MLSAHMDIQPDSVGKVCTVTEEAKRLPFYLDGIGHFECNEEYFTKRRGLRNYLILFTRGGAGVVEYEGHTWQVCPGEALMLDCSRPHYYHTRDADGWSLDWLHLNGASCATYYGLVEKSGNHIHMHRTEAFRHHFSTLYNMPEEQSFSASLTACRQLLSLVTELLQSNTETVRATHAHESRMQAVLQYIEENYHADISLDMLAALAHLSKFYFIHMFQEYMGATPMEYLSSYRLGQAKRLLLTSALSIAEISERVGLGDSSYFIRLFKHENRMTPGEYRRRHL